MAAARFVDRHVLSYDRERARPTELEYIDTEGVNGDPTGIEAVATNLSTHGESNYRIKLSVRVSPAHRIVIWRAALPRAARGQPGMCQYYSPPSKQDGAQLVVEAEETPYQRLFVTVRIQRPDGDDQILMETRLENTNHYDGGFNTELVRSFDNDTFQLHVYVPANRVGQGYR